MFLFVFSIWLFFSVVLGSDLIFSDIGNVGLLSRTYTIKEKYTLEYSFTNLEFYYYEKLTQLYHNDRMRNAMRDMMESMAVMSQFYYTTDYAKKNEMLSSLQLNLLSPFVYKVYLLQNSEDSSLIDWLKFNLAIPHGKLEVHIINKRMTFGDGVDFANTHIAQESMRIKRKLVAVIANNDNLLVSASIVNLRVILDSEWDRTLMVISRVYTYEPTLKTYTSKKRKTQNSQKCRHPETTGETSADVFMFIPPLYYKHTKANLSIPLGTHLIEGLVFSEILKHIPLWGIFNPCRFSNIYHNHRYRHHGTGVIVRTDTSHLSPPYTKLGFPARRFDPALRYTNISIHKTKIK